VYLQEAHKREPKPDINPEAFPHREIEVTEEFLRRNESLLILLAAAVAQSARADSGIHDYDMREALGDLVRTYRTLESGLIYESRPDNPHARRVFSAVQDRISEIREQITGQGMTVPFRDSDILRVLIFLQRMERTHNNGRPKSRAFLEFLQQFFPAAEQPPEQRLVI
jgi:hypothetical protein